MTNNEKSPTKLICFPFSGAGPSFYGGWNDFFNESIEVIPMPLPGRERQIAEEPFKNLHVAADALAKTINNKYCNDSIVLFGHCLGGMLAFEVARRLESLGNIEILQLFVSAARAPHGIRSYSFSGLPDDEFIEGIQDLTGFKHSAFEISELKELLLPTIRADLEMDETYTAELECCINAPITAIFPTNDVLVAKEDVKLWKNYTSSEFELIQVTGEHMYISVNPKQSIDIINEKLSEIYSKGAV